MSHHRPPVPRPPRPRRTRAGIIRHRSGSAWPHLWIPCRHRAESP